MEDKIDVTFKGEKRTLFMSYLRLNSNLRVIGNPLNVANIMVDPDLSENVLRVMLAEKGGPGEFLEVELDENDLSAEDVDRVLLFVQGHVTDFFKRRFQQSIESAKALEPVIKDLESQVSGSES